jgi:hypothetical protein
LGGVWTQRAVALRPGITSTGFGEFQEEIMQDNVSERQMICFLEEGRKKPKKFPQIMIISGI